MIPKIKSSPILIILGILFYSCEKEYSLEGNSAGGTAVFSFIGSPGACTNAVATGTYVAGASLGAPNVVTLSVDVATSGTYTITTPTVNGISFTGSGIFTAIGLQTISLTGNGIPTAPGTFTFSTGITGCAFPVSISGNGGSSGGTAVYSLNNAPGNCLGITTGGVYIAGSVLNAANAVSVSVNVTTIGTYIITTNSANGIFFSGSGNFTSTGLQTITLIGSGIPLVAGAFNYVAGTNGCTFSISVTNGGTATFTYDGAPGSCTNITRGGTYTVGIALTSANKITIDVNVITIGSYYITTPLVNGFSFSGSGNFPNFGYQVVTLTGIGTPIATGGFVFTPSNNGCPFQITVSP